MELNSIEAIKNAVQAGLGAAFVSLSAIEKELQIGLMCRAQIEGLKVQRTLSAIVNPNRYRSKAADAFCSEILPQFTSYTWNSETMNGKKGKAQAAATFVES
jgi:DNA-binding transcriptional LysR family regulator